MGIYRISGILQALLDGGEIEKFDNQFQVILLLRLFQLFFPRLFVGDGTGKFLYPHILDHRVAGDRTA